MQFLIVSNPSVRLRMLGFEARSESISDALGMYENRF